MESWSNH